MGSGCAPSGASFEFGLGTTEIRGRLDLQDAAPLDWQPLVVVYKYHYKFIPKPPEGDTFAPPGTTHEPSLTHPTAHVVTVDKNGEFSLSMPADVVSVYVLFLARERLTDVFRYSRSLGIGRVTYQANLQVMSRGWRSHFYTFLEPQLQNLITEPRYQMSPLDQQRLGTWLSEQKELLEAKSAKKKAKK